MIDLINITKRYKDLTVFEELNLSINDGDFVYLTGESGAGKSTLLNIIALFETFEEGKYILDDVEISDLKRNFAQIRNQYFGFVFQSYHLIDGITAYENIRMPLMYSNLKTDNEKEKIFSIAENLNIKHLLYRKVDKLSGGERQRIAFARAIINNPKYIFCDEPTGNLDNKNSSIVIDLLHEANRSGKTIIIVTHDKELVRRDAKVLYEIREKKLIKIL